MMTDDTVARAFELARQGTCENLEQIRHQLKREGYFNVLEHLNGPAIKKQLAQLIRTKLDNA